MSSSDAEKWRLEGNECFKADRFHEAVDWYSKAIGIEPTPALYCNRAFAYLRIELPGGALSDAEEAIKIEPGFAKAYYRKASAHLFMGKFVEALADFEVVLKLVPADLDAKRKFDECDKMVRKIRFEKAIKSQSAPPISQTIKIGTVSESYVGPRIEEEGITSSFLKEVKEHFRKEKILDRHDVIFILLEALKHFNSCPNVVEVNVPDGIRINVCGDTHGQFYDTLHILEECEEPSPLNWYVFNGDFVDRGSYSVENAVLLLAYKVLLPNCFFISRGNHESITMNRVYGFQGEVTKKYSSEVFELFLEVFNALPIAHVINKEVFVVHGGLYSDDNITIADLQKPDRFREIPESGPICESLWADPQPFPGRFPSKRGVNCKSFGPDVTARFLKNNNLKLVIRSHEVKDGGYAVEHNGMCITVFSAPNYCDEMKNKGAVVQLEGGTMIPKFVVYSESPHPGKKMMYYATFGGGRNIFC